MAFLVSSFDKYRIRGPDEKHPRMGCNIHIWQIETGVLGESGDSLHPGGVVGRWMGSMVDIYGGLWGSREILFARFINLTDRSNQPLTRGFCWRNRTRP